MNFLTDSSGKTTAVVIDIDVWNNILRFHDIGHLAAGDTFKNSTSYIPTNIFTGEPLNLLETKDFPKDGLENKN